MKRYTRHQEEVTPADEMRGHYRLVYRIIQQALVESKSPYQYRRDNACEFIASSDFDMWCQWVAINPDVIRQRVTGIATWITPTS
jgi:hypothetical protein